MITKLDVNASLPLYLQLSNAIRDAISSGEYAPEAKIPTEQDLSRIYAVSRITVRNAIDALANEGLLIKQQGKGTFVAPNKIERNVKSLMGFTESCIAAGQQPATKVLEFSCAHPPRNIAEFLGVDEQTAVVQLSRVRLIDDVPVMIEKDYMPPDFTFLEQEDLTQSLYGAMRKYGYHPVKAKRTFSICYANPEEAGILGVPDYSALLHIFVRIYGEKGEPLHATCQIIRSDRYEITVDI